MCESGDRSVSEYGLWIGVLRCCPFSQQLFPKAVEETDRVAMSLLHLIGPQGRSDYHQGRQANPGKAHNSHESLVKCVKVGTLLPLASSVSKGREGDDSGCSESFPVFIVQRKGQPTSRDIKLPLEMLTTPELTFLNVLFSNVFHGCLLFREGKTKGGTGGYRRIVCRSRCVCCYFL